MKQTQRLYLQFRQHGKTAAQSLYAAKTLIKFQKLEDKGIVRLRAEPEEEGYFDVYGEPESKKERESVVHAIEMNGCWWVVAERLCCKKCDTFEHKDSIGMCIYSDPFDPFENDYVIDLMHSALV